VHAGREYTAMELGLFKRLQYRVGPSDAEWQSLLATEPPPHLPLPVPPCFILRPTPPSPRIRFERHERERYEALSARRRAVSRGPVVRRVSAVLLDDSSCSSGTAPTEVLAGNLAGALLAHRAAAPLSARWHAHSGYPQHAQGHPAHGHLAHGHPAHGYPAHGHPAHGHAHLVHAAYGPYAVPMPPWGMHM